jgi:hypothetical protein
VRRAQFAEGVIKEFQLGLRGVRAQREWVRQGKGTWSEARTRRGLIQVDIRTDYLLQGLLLKYVSRMSPDLIRDGQIRELPWREMLVAQCIIWYGQRVG